MKRLGITRPNMVKKEGYCSPPLDGIWIRSPYLHHGAVPTLRDLLEPVDKRPTSFYRGYDMFDPVNVGFVTQGPAAAQTGWRHDVKDRGNGNQGDIYGTDLRAEEKQALLEYLKTL